MATVVTSQVCELLRRGSDAHENTAELGFPHVALDAVNPDRSVPRHLVTHTLVIEVRGLEAASERSVVPINAVTLPAAMPLS